MDPNQEWLIGIVVAGIGTLIVYAVIAYAELEKFAGSRQKLAGLARTLLPERVIHHFEVVYGTERVRTANKMASLAAKRRGQAISKALKDNKTQNG